ncbi:hypothetical protein BKA80DRAFT_265081 [Phyllosticta citrichinensis]
MTCAGHLVPLISAPTLDHFPLGDVAASRFGQAFQDLISHTAQLSKIVVAPGSRITDCHCEVCEHGLAELYVFLKQEFLQQGGLRSSVRNMHTATDHGPAPHGGIYSRGLCLLSSYP